MASSTKTLMSLINNKVNTLPPEEGFLADLKATVSKLNPTRPSSPYYKPSSLNCLRVMYFDKIQAPKDIQIQEYSGVRIGETGTDSHLRIQGYVSKMRECGFDCDYVDVETYVKEQGLDYLEIKSKKEFETKLFDTRYGVSFLCDGIIKYKGKYYILEIKTETEEKGFARESADPTHQLQSACYSLCLQINEIMWVYEERNHCIPKTYKTTISPEIRTKLLMRIETVEQAVKDMIPPEKTLIKKSCYYCAYKSQCKLYK